VAVRQGNCWFDNSNGSDLYCTLSEALLVRLNKHRSVVRQELLKLGTCLPCSTSVFRNDVPSNRRAARDHALFAPLREVINKVDRMVDIFNGTVENKKVEQNSCGNLNSPSHPLLQEVHDITEWKVESGIDRFIPWQLYEDPLLYHELWYGRSGTHIPQD
jgi:hypothetical protein